VRALAGAAAALTAYRALAARPPGGSERWTRTNHRGRPVSLLSGPALVIGATATARLPPAAAAVAALGAGAIGAYDDAAGGTAARGFRGHLAALRRGQVTTGSIKIAGLAVVGLVAARRLPRQNALDTVVAGAVVAGTANLVNLLDLRPGRALKAAGLLAAVLGQPGVAGACMGLLPGDLREETMIGDAGANGTGALLGLALVRGLPRRSARLAALGVLVGITAASEVVSFSAVIDRTPVLRALDRLGRRP
jgi:hypothetical protein